MMKIPLRCACGHCGEWALLEMQGSLEIQPAAQEHLQNIAIGSLCRVSVEKFSFTVGYHELEGRKVHLKKPLLVLRKCKQDDLMNIESASMTSQSHSAQIQGVKMEVAGIIRQKLLFKTRPKALISKPEVKVKKINAATGPAAT